MSEPCGCKIVLKGDVTIVHGDEGSDIYEIVYCPKHQAVDLLLETAKQVSDVLHELEEEQVTLSPSQDRRWSDLSKAITAAEGKPA